MSFTQEWSDSLRWSEPAPIPVDGEPLVRGETANWGNVQAPHLKAYTGNAPVVPNRHKEVKNTGFFQNSFSGTGYNATYVQGNGTIPREGAHVQHLIDPNYRAQHPPSQQPLSPRSAVPPSLPSQVPGLPPHVPSSYQAQVPQIPTQKQGVPSIPRGFAQQAPVPSVPPQVPTLNDPGQVPQLHSQVPASYSPQLPHQVPQLPSQVSTSYSPQLPSTPYSPGSPSVPHLPPPLPSQGATPPSLPSYGATPPLPGASYGVTPQIPPQLPPHHQQIPNLPPPLPTHTQAAPFYQQAPPSPNQAPTLPGQAPTLPGQLPTFPPQTPAPVQQTRALPPPPTSY